MFAASCRELQAGSLRSPECMRASIFLLTAAFVLSGLVACKRQPAQSRIDPNGPVEVLPPEHGAYTGAFMDFGDEEDDVTL